MPEVKRALFYIVENAFSANMLQYEFGNIFITTFMLDTNVIIVSLEKSEIH